MKYLILILIFLVVAGCIVDAYLWHKEEATVPCTVVFKPDPTVSRGGCPYYFVEVRRNDNNAWSQQTITGEFYSTLNKGDVANFTLYDMGFGVLHCLGTVFGAIAFIIVALVLPGKKSKE
jgi:hypothetical protein